MIPPHTHTDKRGRPDLAPLLKPPKLLEQRDKSKINLQAAFERDGDDQKESREERERKSVVIQSSKVPNATEQQVV